MNLSALKRYCKLLVLKPAADKLTVAMRYLSHNFHLLGTYLSCLLLHTVQRQPILSHVM